jgi:thiol-disulfide isomerase/thioredoxin
MKSQKKLFLIIILVLVVGSIAYLEYTKPKIGPATDIILNDDNVVETTTGTSTVTELSASSTPIQTVTNRSTVRAQKASKYTRAKEISDPQGFVNTPSLTLASLVGKKVVLVDFWTYSCINCQRTIPYLNAWYQKYKDLGLEIVGVHTPEFDFEKNQANVSKAVADLGIKYPVVLDSNRGTWTAYSNLYWPHEYLIDIDGFIVHDHIGEGSYAESERAIQAALKERAQALGLNISIPTSIVNPNDVISVDQGKVQSPETYFGYSRNEYFANGEKGRPGSQILTVPTQITGNKLYLGGTWNFQGEYAENTTSGATIQYQYNAKNVYFVGSSNKGVTLKVYQDGKLINTVNVKDNKLYTLVQNPDYGIHTLKIEVEGVGLDAYTFTFG